MVIKMDQINQIKRVREEYILKELVKTARIFTFTNWVIIGLIVLYAAIAAFRVANGTGLPKMTSKLVYQFIWTAGVCLYVRQLETRYKDAVEETRRAMNDPSFPGYSERTKTVRDNTIKSAAGKVGMAVIWGGLGVFFAALGALTVYLSWLWKKLPSPGEMVFYSGFLVAGVLLIVYGVSEWRGAPEGKRLLGFYPAIISQCDSGGFVSSAGEDDLSQISCPEQGFTTKADPAYSRKYAENGTFFIYIGDEGYVPYVCIRWSSELTPDDDLRTYMSETFRSHMHKEYGDRLHYVVEYGTYEIGGRKLSAGLYVYDNENGTTLEMLRLYDIIGGRVAVYEAKYVQGEGEKEKTMNALDKAIRYFKEDWYN